MSTRTDRLDATITAVAAELLSDFLETVDGSNHKVGICFCADHASLYALRLAQEDEAALEQHRSSLKNN